MNDLNPTLDIAETLAQYAADPKLWVKLWDELSKYPSLEGMGEEAARRVIQEAAEKARTQ